MTSSDKKYYIDQTLSKNDSGKWRILLGFAFSAAEHVEFNILRSDSELKNIIDDYNDELIVTGKRKNKIYSKGEFIRFRLSERLKEFIVSREYPAWNNYCLEDISLLTGCTELLATITHENYVFLLMTELQTKEFNIQGFNFTFAFNRDDNP